MKIRLIIKDLEYCLAFRNNITSADKDIMVEISKGGKLNGIDSKTIIVTDVDPKRVDKRLINQTVFLTKDQNDTGEKLEGKYRKIFKYLRTSKILSFIEETYCDITGRVERINSGTSRVFAVCSDSNSCNAILCKTLARQIVYRHGGEILILPLRYINEYFDPNEKDNNRLSKLLYYLKSGKECPLEGYLYRDNYGINYLCMGKGINPISKLELDELVSLIKVFCKDKFDTVILDIGDCFSDINNEVISKSDNIILLRKDATLNLEDVFVDEETRKRASSIELYDNEKDLELLIDDYIDDVYKLGDLDYEQE